jgi:hypothetical protein
MEALAREPSSDGEPAFAPPALSSVEALVEYGLRRAAGRVFADLWEIERFARCPHCSPARIARLRRMNETQRVPASIGCARCGADSGGIA